MLLFDSHKMVSRTKTHLVRMSSGCVLQRLLSVSDCCEITAITPPRERKVRFCPIAFNWLINNFALSTGSALEGSCLQLYCRFYFVVKDYVSQCRKIATKKRKERPSNIDLIKCLISLPFSHENTVASLMQFDLPVQLCERRFGPFC